jgi:hypothetical protein
MRACDPVGPRPGFGSLTIRDAGSVRAGTGGAAVPRPRASDLLLLGKDFWVFDGRLLRFGYFNGDGEHSMTS